jgi:cell wall-associated NlpC family hydrolase
MDEVNLALSLHIPYRWGEESYKGADCSGILFITARRAGLPVMRTTSARMLRGAGGWGGKTISILPYTSPCDLVGFTMSEARPLGHIGVLLAPITVAHASSTRGFVREKMRKGFLNKIRIIVRPNFLSPTSY